MPPVIGRKASASNVVPAMFEPFSWFRRKRGISVFPSGATSVAERSRSDLCVISIVTLMSAIVKSSPTTICMVAGLFGLLSGMACGEAAVE